MFSLQTVSNFAGEIEWTVPSGTILKERMDPMETTQITSHPRQDSHSEAITRLIESVAKQQEAQALRLRHFLICLHPHDHEQFPVGEAKVWRDWC